MLVSIQVHPFPAILASSAGLHPHGRRVPLDGPARAGFGRPADPPQVGRQLQRVGPLPGVGRAGLRIGHERCETRRRSAATVARAVGSLEIPRRRHAWSGVDGVRFDEAKYEVVTCTYMK